MDITAQKQQLQEEKQKGLSQIEALKEKDKELARKIKGLEKALELAKKYV